MSVKKAGESTPDPTEDQGLELVSLVRDEPNGDEPGVVREAHFIDKFGNPVRLYFAPPDDDDLAVSD